MNKEILKGKWKEIKGQVKTQWGKLTDDELTKISGDYDQLSGSLQKQYGYKKDEAEAQINKFFKDIDD